MASLLIGNFHEVWEGLLAEYEFKPAETRGDLIALKTEYNPGSVEQIETSSRMISRIVMKLANIDVQALLQAQAGAGGGVNVEQMGRAGSL